MRQGEARARELAIVASSKLEDLLNRIFNKLSDTNKQLFEVQLQIKELQAGNKFIYLLELHGCGKECAGCPHAKWTKYTWVSTKQGERKLIHENIDPTKMDPAQLMPKSSKNYGELIKNVRIAKKLIKDKTTILTRLRPFWQLSK